MEIDGEEDDREGDQVIVIGPEGEGTDTDDPADECETGSERASSAKTRGPMAGEVPPRVTTWGESVEPDLRSQETSFCDRAEDS